MSISPPGITGLVVSGTVDPAVLNPLSASIPFTLPFTFTGMTNMSVLTNSYLPADNIVYPFQDISATIAPTFLMLFCDNPLKITMESNSGSAIPINDLDVAKFFMFVQPPGALAPFSFWLDGRLGIPNPMGQSTIVNYTLVYGQASVS